MWKWMVGKRKSAHPLDRELESARTRQRFIAGLAEQSASDALKAVTQIVEACGELELRYKQIPFRKRRALGNS
jgi:hypothetical protein